MELKNKKILVCGMALSGISSAVLLNKLGAEVTIQDIKEESKFAAVPGQLEKSGIKTYLGKNPDDILPQQDLMILSPGIPCDLPFIEKARELSIPIWGEIELAYTLCAAPILAITGTNGKTTTTALVGEIMYRFNKGTEVVGNIGVPFTDKVLSLTKNDYVAAEISSFQLETIHSFKPAVSAVLNITPDHLNRHKTIENYTLIKERIFENQTSGDYTILNFDDNACREMSDRTKGKTIFFSRKNKLKEGVYLDEGFIVAHMLGICEKIVHIDGLQIFGDHNIENVLAATAITICAGVPVDIISHSLRKFKGVAHRIEFVTEKKDIYFYNDSKATNTDAAIKSIEAMKQPIVLIGGGYDKGLDFGDWVKTFAGKVKRIIVLGEVSGQIIDTCKAYNFNEYDKVNSLKDAVELAYSKAEPGDCVLLSPACASWDMFDNYEQRGNLFKEFVNAL